MKDNLKSTTDLVLDTLRNTPATRSNDMLLYLRICARLNGAAVDMPFGHVLMHLDELKIPKFETVRRARQKVQATFPELAANSEVEALRALNEQAYRKYARGEF